MPTQVIMPQLGESVEEGTITRWLKTVGEQVEEYEPLLEINTDKVDTEIPSPQAGTLLEILAPEGATVQAGAALALIGEFAPSGLQPATSHTQPGTPAVPAPPPAQPAPAAPPPAGREPGFISPLVARMAGELRVDLSKVTGTGLSGRITKKDLLAYIENRPTQPTDTPAPAAIPTANGGPAANATPAPAGIPAHAPAAAAGSELLPLTTVRRAIAEHMVNSRRTSPHVSTIMEADLSRVIAHRTAHKEAFARDGVNLTFTAYFLAASVTALKAHPLVNSSWSEQGILLHQAINVGVAASLGEAGLIVPVVKHADGLSLLGLARAVNDLAGRARQRKLLPDEVRDGTFTITNHGVSGSLFAMPIINQPQCAILGVGAIQKRVVVISDETHGDTIAIRPMVYLSLTFDHRLLDGAAADVFLGSVVESLQTWGTASR